MQDTQAGLGDLLVMCERGVVSLSVSVPRSSWKSTPGFQRIVLTDVGCVGPTSISSTNGDVFFRSFDGIRTYRNARAEIGVYGQVPISTEMEYVLNRDSQNYLGSVSSITFDNRLLVTCTPKIDYSNSNYSTTGKLRPVTFGGIVSLDFTAVTGVGAKRTPAYDGVWTGLDTVQLLSGLIAGKPKAFIVSLDYTNSGLLSLWEITRDSDSDKTSDGAYSPIRAIIETRALSFQTPLEQKKLIRADLWISELSGSVDFEVYWRPDEYPCWRPWHSFSRCATVENCIVGTPTVSSNSGSWTLTYNSTALERYKIVADKTATSLLQFTLQSDDSSTVSSALTAAGITHTSVIRTGVYPNYVYTINGPVSVGGTDVSRLTVIPVQGTTSNFAPKNYVTQYRPQVRLPTPPDDTDPIVNKAYTYGNNFQLRLEWEGRATISRYLILVQRILEQYQGIDFAEL
jgi:hypothetical protein